MVHNLSIRALDGHGMVGYRYSISLLLLQINSVGHLLTATLTSL